MFSPQEIQSIIEKWGRPDGLYYYPQTDDFDATRGNPDIIPKKFGLILLASYIESVMKSPMTDNYYYLVEQEQGSIDFKIIYHDGDVEREITEEYDAFAIEGRAFAILRAAKRLKRH